MLATLLNIHLHKWLASWLSSHTKLKKIMAKSHGRSPRLSISRSISRVRVHSPSLQRKKVSSNPVETDQNVEFLGGGNAEAVEYVGNESSGSERYGNKVMVVVDSSLDAKGALEWALSHTVQCQDTIVLLHVIAKSSKQGKEKTNGKKLYLRVYEKLHSMKNTCQLKKPGVQVEIAITEGKEKGPIIVEEAKRQNVSLLVLGQKGKSIVWRLMKRWSSKKKAVGDIVDYCIQNSSRMTIAVRRKSSKLGGYLITTKRHKNFWLLA